jgi:phosphoribosylglycinamide formyltransferase-1
VKRLVVFLSGSGTTLLNLDRVIQAGELPARIVGVVASRPDLLGVERAKTLGYPVQVVQGGATLSEQAFAAARAWQADLVLLAGWLKLLQIPEDYTQRVLNMHPSLLPAFGGHGMYGLRVHTAVIAAGATESGCTVHYADNRYDTGPIVLQRRVPVLPNDTPQELANRVFAAECEAYPEAIRQVLAQLPPYNG